MTVGGANPNGVGAVVPLWAASAPVVPPAPGFGASGVYAFAPDAVYADPIGGVLAAAGSRTETPLVLFDDAADEEIFFQFATPTDYAGGNATVTVFWTSVAVAGSVVWEVAFEPMVVGTYNVDTPTFLADVAVSAAAPAVSGDLESAVLVVPAAQVGTLAGQIFRLKVARDADDAGDTLVGDAQFLGLTIT